MNKKILALMMVISLIITVTAAIGYSAVDPIQKSIVEYPILEEYTIEELCKLEVPENWWIYADFDPCTSRGTLPESFDWRELGGCTPIKNQGGCGSCWSFSTVAPLECNILIHDGIEVDLSEQWLVSECVDSGDCDGGWFAHDYHEWRTDSFGGVGAVLEENYPYVAYNTPCDGPYIHSYLINDWRFIGYSGGIPPVDSMKQAILDYGPISVAVAVNSAFASYPGGVFSGPTSDDINHAVALVGWDDTLGDDGVWILRNSWGSGWGDNGYMYIEYGVCEVGYAANYVDYTIQPVITIPQFSFGIIAQIENIGIETLSDLDWEMTVSGGILDRINIYRSGTILILEPNEMIEQREIRFGFGLINIKVIAGNAIKEVDALLIGFTVINL